VKYSALALVRGALTGGRSWTPAWRFPEPKPRYQVLIIGGGGHGLATAYYLAKNHGVRDVAVLERGWLGGGNTGRNTTIVRSNYLFPESARLYDFSLQLYESLSCELNFNIMLSQRGLILLAHSRHDLDSMARWANAMQMNGIDAQLLTRAQVAERAPLLEMSPEARFPVLGGFLQRRAGTARHDAVAWGYARAADALGVDIIQNCEVTGFTHDAHGAVTGVRTSRGAIAAGRIGIAAAGHSSVLAKLAGFALPVTSYALQAMVSEPVKPVLDTVVLSPGTGAYVSQSDKGEMVLGASLDLFRIGGRRPLEIGDGLIIDRPGFAELAVEPQQVALALARLAQAERVFGGGSRILLGIRRAKRTLTDDDRRLVEIFNRRGTNVMVMLLFVASGIVLVCGEPNGLYLLLPASLVAQVSGVLNAWFFLLPPTSH